MKKLLILLLCVCLGFTMLTGCSKSKDVKDTENTESTESETTSQEDNESLPSLEDILGSTGPIILPEDPA